MTDSANWLRVAGVADVPAGEMLAVEAAGRPIAVFHLEDGTWAATDNVCTHAFAVLTDGWLDGEVIECPLHAGRFDVRTGKGLCAPIEQDIRTYPVRVDGRDVLVEVVAITPAGVAMMAAYNTEMNQRIYAAAGRLSDAERKQDRGAFWHSIHGTLNHLLWGDRAWMARFAAWPTPAQPLAQSYSIEDDFASLAAARAEADAGIAAWAVAMDPAWLAGEQTWYSHAAQRDLTHPRARLVTHLFNHQTHHRGQVHALLTAAGEQTGDTDLPFVLAS